MSSYQLDSWATGEETTITTIAIQSICLCTSFCFLCLRCYQVYGEKIIEQSSCRKDVIAIRLLQASHLLAMAFSTLYILTHMWNYIHLYREHNPIHCSTWFAAIILTLYSSKTFSYTFLMLRSALAFNTQMFRIPMWVCITYVATFTLCIWTIGGIMFVDHTPISPFPEKGFCFRIPGQHFTNASPFSYVADGLAGIVALIIFWAKAAQVRKLFPHLQEMDASTKYMNAVFRKHIFLGTLIALSSLIIVVAGQFFTVLLGICFALQQTFNNLCILLMFKENEKLYGMVCCSARQVPEESDHGDEVKAKVSQIVDEEDRPRFAAGDSSKTNNLGLPSDTQTHSKDSTDGGSTQNSVVIS